MDASNWKRLKELFDEARLLQDERRRVFLEEIHSTQPLLYQQLELLLDSYEDASGYFEQLAGAIAPGPDPIDLLTGQTISHYEIQEPLGEGGMGVVYKARHLLLERPAALKFLSPLLSADVEAKERLIHEARATYALDHPNICTIYDVGETDSGQVYIAMAFYEGKTLAEKIRRSGLTLSQALDYASQMCEGLAKAHTAGIVHGDVKPSNVIITHDGVVKLLDFGVADVAGLDTDLSALRMGTVAYMSPERLEDGRVDHRTDIWSFGVVLYEMLAGSHPFRSNGDSTGTVIHTILDTETRELPTLIHDVPGEVGRIIRRCLARSPGERYQTVAALFADLHAAKRAIPTLKSDSPGVVFLVYKRGADPDQRIAAAIRRAFEPDREVVLGDKPVVSTRWIEQLEADLERSGVLIVLLSPEAAHSEMVVAELEVAARVAERRTSGLTVLTVRLGFHEPIPYPLMRYVDDSRTTYWEDDRDTQRLIAEIEEAMTPGTLRARPGSIATGSDDSPATHAASGADARPAVPAPFTKAWPMDLTNPVEAEDYDSEFYVERTSDAEALKAIDDDGVTVTIKGPRQMGKTSLLVRVARRATERGKATAVLDFQMFEHAVMQNADRFFRRFCVWISDSLGLEDQVESYWKPPVGNSHKCSRYVLRHVLRGIDRPFLLAMDEVERVFDTPFRLEFFSMLRSWHNNRAVQPELRRLDLVLATSTEPYELLKAPNLSPFNVGEVISLEDFSSSQVRRLNERCGASLTEDQVAGLTDLLHGHPYLVRRALYLLSGHHISFEELLASAPDDHGPFEDHLGYHLFRLHEREDLIDGLRTVLSGGRCDDETVVWHLLGAGLIRREGRDVVSRSPLYSDYFRRKLLG